MQAAALKLFMLWNNKKLTLEVKLNAVPKW